MTQAKKIKEAKNTLRVSRDKDEPEPMIINFSPPAPENLSEGAAIIWNDLIPKLVSLQIFTNIDTNIFANYCEELALYNTATKELMTNGYVNIAQSGFEVPSVWVGIKNKALVNAMAIAKEFGLSPAARTKISISKSKPEGLRASILKKTAN
jgi:P27 family predicted phage terminase small subunit